MKDVETFVAERRPRWERLERALRRVQASTAREVGREGIQEIVTLYRSACSDLNRARSLTANPEILERLNQLTGRAYRFVHGAMRRRVSVSVRRFLSAEAPLTFRREARHVVAAAGSLALGALLGFAAVTVEPSNAELLIPWQFFTESPSERVEKIESGEERVRDLETALAFGSSLYVHNIKVSFLAFSLGALTIVLGHLILFHNGVLLGAVAAWYHLDGVQVFFYAWVGPHGALEIPAIVFAAAAGLKLGEALLFPGERTRRASLAEALPPASRMLVTAMIVLVAAGLIEGSFSQFSSRVVPFAVKIAFAAVLFASLFAWLFVSGRRAPRVGPA